MIVTLNLSCFNRICKLSLIFRSEELVIRYLLPPSIVHFSGRSCQKNNSLGYFSHIVLRRQDSPFSGRWWTRRLIHEVEIEPGNQFVDAFGSSQIQRQNLTGEPYALAVLIEMPVIDSRLSDIYGAYTCLNSPPRQTRQAGLLCCSFLS